MALYGFVHLSINLRSARQRVTTNSRRLLMTSEVIENRRAHNAGRFLVETKRNERKRNPLNIRVYEFFSSVNMRCFVRELWMLPRQESVK